MAFLQKVKRLNQRCAFFYPGLHLFMFFKSNILCAPGRYKATDKKSLTSRGFQFKRKKKIETGVIKIIKYHVDKTNSN
jgi:hypothetical protein